MAAVIRATGRVILAAMVVAASLGCQDIAFVSTLQKVVNGQKWVQVTNNAAWSPRRQFALLSFNGKLWLAGVEVLQLQPTTMMSGAQQMEQTGLWRL